MQLLGFGPAQIQGQLDGLDHVLAVGVDADGLAAGVGVHLFFFPVQGEGGQSRNAHVVAQGLFEGGSVPRTGEHRFDAAVTHTGQARAVGIYDEVGVVVQVDQVVGDFHCIVTAKVGAQLFLGAVAEQGAAVAEVEGRQVPGVGEGEADHALGQHGVQVLDVVLGKDALVVVHEPGVGGKGHAVDVAVHGQAVHQALAVGVCDLVGVDAAELGQCAGVGQGGQGVVGEHEHVGAGLGVLADGAGRARFIRNAVDKGDVPLGVQLGKAIAAGLQPLAAVLGLVLGRAPDHQADVFTAALGTAAHRAAHSSGPGCRRSQTQEVPSGHKAGCGSFLAHVQFLLFASQNRVRRALQSFVMFRVGLTKPNCAKNQEFFARLRTICEQYTTNVYDFQAF